jgi:hypothetical protein
MEQDHVVNSRKCQTEPKEPVQVTAQEVLEERRPSPPVNSCTVGRGGIGPVVAFKAATPELNQTIALRSKLQGSATTLVPLGLCVFGAICDSSSCSASSCVVNQPHRCSERG